MRIFKTLALLFICFSLLMGGVASAAMPCCMGKNMSQMQMDNSKSDMPCHKDTSNGDTKNHNSCEKCKNCVATSAVISSQENEVITFTSIHHNEPITGFVSHNPNGIYSPPKHIS
ncbi:MAG: hypothetical protein COV35_00825 [Alphaproteobacteria bacterium CG11_big_fil_rev_8_21_14_0_20_39_49]|nr:MAG: hypothetical protein COV35_00825 [Alphaproteobacteria bacterium CG11_big_fil_rev_8_21_14_0_20_39_49]